jgi:4-hydroxybenzoate polyprenyltransferase
MIWALLAAFLTKRPAWVQAVVVGLCTGLFVAAGAHANQRDPLISSVVLLVLAVAVVAGVGFHLAHGFATAGPRAAPRRRGSTSSMPRCGCCP